MRVMHVIETLEHGGAEAVVVDLANACQPPHEITVCCTKRTGELTARLDPAVSRFCLGAGEGNDWRTPWRLAREARRRRVQVLHSHSWGVFLETALASVLSGCRMVHTVHGPYLRHGSSRSQRLRARLRRWCERLAARRVAGMACVAEPLRDFVRDEMRMRVPLSVIHNGVGEVPLAPNVRTGEPYRLVSVGRLAVVKGYDVLLRAFARAHAEQSRLRLTLVGDGPERERLAELAAHLGIDDDVDFVGFRNDVAAILNTQDVFVLASHHEGISIAILEAMRAGLPVVATDVGGVAETVADGVTGELVPADDPDRLARALVRLLRAPGTLRSMGRAGRAVQQRRFSLARMRDAYLQMYRGRQESRPATLRSATRDAGLRILYHHRTQGRGAEGAHVAGIVNALRDQGHEVTVLGPPGIDALSTAGAAPVDKSSVRTRGAATLWKLISRHAPALLFEFAEIGYNVLASWRLSRAWRRHRYDLVYERYAFYMVAGARSAARHGVPFVLEANEVSGVQGRARPQVLPRLCGRFEDHLLARCDAVFAVSSDLRARVIARGVHPQRVRVVPNAVDTTVVTPQPRRVDLCRRFDLEGRTVVGFAGWFDPWDRLDLLLDAMPRLISAHPQLVVMLIGDGPTAGTLRSRAAELGVAASVRFTGAVPRAEMADHLALFDIAVLPHSNSFGSPFALFEFMASSLPVVAPRLAPMTDVLEDGATGLLFDSGDLEGMIGALARLIESSDLRRRLGVAARYRVETEHTWAGNAAVVMSHLGHRPACEAFRRAS